MKMTMLDCGHEIDPTKANVFTLHLSDSISMDNCWSACSAACYLPVLANMLKDASAVEVVKQPLEVTG